MDPKTLKWPPTSIVQGDLPRLCPSSLSASFRASSELRHQSNRVAVRRHLRGVAGHSLTAQPRGFQLTWVRFYGLAIAARDSLRSHDWLARQKESRESSLEN